MLAAAYLTSGPGEGVLESRELPDPAPGPGEVRVRVAVSGVNPTDWKARRSGRHGASDAPEIVPNQDGAGTIDAVGEGVDPARVGQRVWLYEAQWRRSRGTAAQHIALPAGQAVPLPDSASFDLGASIGIPAMTAHRCLFADGSPPTGAPVLVHGGAGAVAHAAIELAVWNGVRVATTVSSDEKARLARAAGAELVVNYRAEDVVSALREWAPDGVTRIVDVDPVTNLGLDAQVLAPGAAISCYAGAGAATELPWALMSLNATVEFVLVYTMPLDAKRAAVADISRALEDGVLTTLPLHRFALEQAAAAHDAVEAGAIGKVLIDIP
jgi:NADPH2:quinone reductase